MNPIARLALTEILEHMRQPWMLAFMVLGYLLPIGICGAGFWSLDGALSNPAQLVQLLEEMAALGFVVQESELRLLLPEMLLIYFSVLMSPLPVLVAYMAAYSVLHDREQGVLPFVMLAPLPRWQFLLGKVLGCMALPTLMHLGFVALGCFPLSKLGFAKEHDAFLGASSVWWVIYLVVGPAFSIFIGIVGAVISAMSRDIRTSLQIMSLLFWVLGAGFSVSIVRGFELGVGVQLAVAVGCLVLSVVVLAIGSRVLRQELV